VTHGKNIRVLIFEENASEAVSLACLLSNSDNLLQMNTINKAGKLKTALNEDSPGILTWSARIASPELETTQPLLAGRNPELTKITITDTCPDAAMIEANRGDSATLVAYDQPDGIRREFSIW
jgi:hypothetical protein